MNISEMITQLEELKEKHGDLPCATESCEQLWMLRSDCIFFMEKRAVREVGSYDGQLTDVIIIG